MDLQQSDSLTAEGGTAEGLVVDDLARLFIAGSIYSCGHPRVRDHSVELLARLEPLFASQGECSFEISNEAFLYADQPLPTSGPAERLHRNLYSLAIDRITFTRDVSVEDLTQFVACLQDAVQTSVQGRWSFSRWRTSLPENVRCERRQYGVTVQENRGGAMDRQTRQRMIEFSLAPLKGWNVDPSARKRLQQFTEQMLDSASKLVSQDPDDGSAPPSRQSQEDLLALTAQGLHNIVKRWLDEEQELSLDDLFQEFEEVFAASSEEPLSEVLAARMREAVEELLLEHFKFDGPQVLGARRATPSEREIEGPAIHQDILQFLGDDQKRMLIQLGDRWDELGILLRVLMAADVKAHPQLLARVRRLLGDRPSPRLLEKMGPALGQIQHGGHPEALEGLLTVIFEACGNEASTKVPPILIRLCEGDPSGSVPCVWPYIVLALLTPGAGREHETERTLLELLGTVPQTSVRQDRKRLVKALQILPADREVALPVSDHLYPIYAIVLEESRLRGHHAAVLRAIQEHPPESPFAGAVRALDHCDSVTARFIADVLWDHGHTEPNLPLIRVATRFVINRLDSLSNPRSNEGMALAWIEALRELPCHDSRQYLERIQTERKALRKRWPPVLRQAAARALTQMPSSLLR